MVSTKNWKWTPWHKLQARHALRVGATTMV